LLHLVGMPSGLCTTGSSSGRRFQRGDAVLFLAPDRRIQLRTLGTVVAVAYAGSTPQYVVACTSAPCRQYTLAEDKLSCRSGTDPDFALQGPQLVLRTDSTTVAADAHASDVARTPSGLCTTDNSSGRNREGSLHARSATVSTAVAADAHASDVVGMPPGPCTTDRSSGRNLEGSLHAHGATGAADALASDVVGTPPGPCTTDTSSGHYPEGSLHAHSATVAADALASDVVGTPSVLFSYARPSAARGAHAVTATQGVSAQDVVAPAAGASLSALQAGVLSAAQGAHAVPAMPGVSAPVVVAPASSAPQSTLQAGRPSAAQGAHAVSATQGVSAPEVVAPVQSSGLIG
jgi:hypothetical protein